MDTEKIAEELADAPTNGEETARKTPASAREWCENAINAANGTIKQAGKAALMGGGPNDVMPQVYYHVGMAAVFAALDIADAVRQSGFELCKVIAASKTSSFTQQLAGKARH